MRRRSTTTWLIVKVSRMLQEMVGVLSVQERGMAICASRNAARRVALWITREARSRSEFGIVPLMCFNKTKYVMVSGGKGCRQTRL